MKITVRNLIRYLFTTTVDPGPESSGYNSVTKGCAIFGLYITTVP